MPELSKIIDVSDLNEVDNFFENCLDGDRKSLNKLKKLFSSDEFIRKLMWYNADDDVAAEDSELDWVYKVNKDKTIKYAADIDSDFSDKSDLVWAYGTDWDNEDEFSTSEIYNMQDNLETTIDEFEKKVRQ